MFYHHYKGYTLAREALRVDDSADAAHELFDSIHYLPDVLVDLAKSLLRAGHECHTGKLGLIVRHFAILQGIELGLREIMFVVRLAESEHKMEQDFAAAAS